MLLYNWPQGTSSKILIIADIAVINFLFWWVGWKGSYERIFIGYKAKQNLKLILLS